MGFKKLALASAIIAASSSAFALEAMDDETLSATTGQAGITIEMNTNVQIGQLRIHDADGLNGVAVTPYDLNSDGDTADAGEADIYAGFKVGAVGADTGGSIVITGDGAGSDALTITSAGPSTLTIDAGNNGTNSLLHIGAALGATTIGLDGTRIGVARGDGVNAGALDQFTSFLSFNDDTVLNLGATNLNIDLGHQPSGHLIFGTVSMTEDGVTNNVIDLTSLNINHGAASIALGNIGIAANGGNTLSMDVGIGVSATQGLYINTKNMTGLDVSLGSVALGTAASIGAVYVDNLRLQDNTIYVRGH